MVHPGSKWHALQPIHPDQQGTPRTAEALEHAANLVPPNTRAVPWYQKQADKTHKETPRYAADKIRHIFAHGGADHNSGHGEDSDEIERPRVSVTSASDGEKRSARRLVFAKKSARFGYRPGKCDNVVDDDSRIVDHRSAPSERPNGTVLNVQPLSTPTKEGLDLFNKGQWQNVSSGVVQQLSSNVVDQFNVIYRLFHGAASNARASQDAEIQQVLRKVTKDLRDAFEVTNKSFGYLLSTLRQQESVVENERARVAALEEQLYQYEESFVKQAKTIEEMKQAMSGKDIKALIDEKVSLEKKLSRLEKTYREHYRRFKDTILKLQEQLKAESVCKRQLSPQGGQGGLPGVQLPGQPAQAVPVAGQQTGHNDSVTFDSLSMLDGSLFDGDSDEGRADTLLDKISNQGSLDLSAQALSVTKKQRYIRNDNTVKIKTLSDKVKRCKNALGLSSTALILLRQLFGLLQCPECHNPYSVPKVTLSGNTVCAACLPKHFKARGGDPMQPVADNRVVDAFLAEFRKSLPANLTELVRDIQMLQQEA